jgi:O-antigen/teichoic acid export membrane protein
MKAVPFFKNLGRLLFLNGLVKPLWIFGVDRQVQNIVGFEAYGTYFSLFNLAYVLLFVTDAGLSNMMNRQWAAGVPGNVKQLLRIKAGLTVLYCGLVTGTAWLTGAALWPVLLPVIGIQVGLSFFLFLRSLITAHQLFGLDAWLSVMDKVLMLSLFLPLLYTQLFQIPITLSFFLYAQLGCTFLALALAAAGAVKNGLFYSTAVVQNVSVVFKSVLPYALIILLMAAHSRLDAFLLERLHAAGAYEAGVYAAGYRLLDAANMIGYLVASFLVPFLARHRNEPLLVQDTVSKIGYGLLLYGLFASLFLVCFAVPVQQVLYPAGEGYTALVIQWCLAVLPAYLLLHVYGSVLTALGQLNAFLRILTGAVVVNTIMNIILIPAWGAVGCCLAALVSQYGFAGVVYVVASRKNKIAVDVKGWGRLFAVGLVLGCLFYVGRQQAISPVLLFLVGGSIVMLALFIYLPFLKRLFIFR